MSTDATTGNAGGAPAGAAPAPSVPDSGQPAGGSAPAWHAGFADKGLATHASVQKFKDPESLAKSYVELEKSAVFLPKDNTRESWEKVWNRLGRPETPEGYNLKAPVLPEGAEFDRKPFEGFSSFAHSIGLSQWQAQELVNWAGQKQAIGGSGSKLLSPAKMEKVLRQKWGDAVYDHNIALTQRAVAHIGGDALAKALKETGAAYHPDVVAALATVGGFLAEENVIPASTPAQVSGRAEYDALFNNKDSAYWDRKHPDHKKAVERVTELAQLVKR